MLRGLQLLQLWTVRLGVEGARSLDDVLAPLSDRGELETLEWVASVQAVTRKEDQLLDVRGSPHLARVDGLLHLPGLAGDSEALDACVSGVAKQKDGKELLMWLDEAEDPSPPQAAG